MALEFLGVSVALASLVRLATRARLSDRGAEDRRGNLDGRREAREEARHMPVLRCQRASDAVEREKDERSDGLCGALLLATTRHSEQSCTRTMSASERMNDRQTHLDGK